jgi:response regulator RpfG family c-di-GMP phosphodiesterase
LFIRNNRLEYGSYTSGKLSKQNQFISVVDDEPDIAYLFRDVLSSINGVRVFAFTDPVLALEHFRVKSRDYKCVISDFRMPSLNGAQFLDKIKEVNPEVKRILISAFDIDDDLFKDCHSIDKFLPKPIMMSDLIEEVRKHVNKVEIKQNS